MHASYCMYVVVLCQLPAQDKLQAPHPLVQYFIRSSSRLLGRSSCTYLCEQSTMLFMYLCVLQLQNALFHISSRLLDTKQCTPTLITQRKDPFLLHLLSYLRCSIRVCEVWDSSSLLHWAIPVNVALQQHASLVRGAVQ